ncbi:MAG: zinc-dependent peptidase [Acidimicrobiia bacterium]|nr:zinc-dependent peptidase [Acidimicrobiia bacterium]
MKIGRNRRQVDFPEQWRKVLGERLRWWPLGDAELQRNLEQTVIGFLSSKSFESARGLDLTEDIKVTIAAQASLLVLGIGLDEYRDVTTIIVYPSTAVRSSKRRLEGGIESQGPTALSGESMLHGPVMVTWDSALKATRHPERGHNVVFHEFAHKLDMADGVTDGVPRLQDREAHRDWMRVMKGALADLREGRPRYIDSYGAVGLAELFAVLTEAFFTVPAELKIQEPEIYALLSSFYRLDPADW